MNAKVSFRAGGLLIAALFTLFLTAEISASSLASVTNAVSSSASENSEAERDEQKIFDLVNREREKEGLSDLRWRDDLSRLARSYAEKMARGNFFSHFEPDGADVVERARAASVKGWSKIGENLFFCAGFREYDRFAIRSWMKSDSHRNNILDPEYTATGIGLARSPGGKIYVAQVFITD